MTQLVYERVHDHLKGLRLNTVDAILDNTLQSSQAASKSFLEIMDDLLTSEVQARRASSIETRTKLSALPTRKSLDDFDYAFQPSLDAKVIQELRTLRFLHNAENVVILGPPGVGKTHIAIGLAVEAIQAGFMAYYTNMTNLVERLKRARKRDQLESQLRVFTRPKLLVLDEVGYQVVDREAANLVFELITRRYENGSTVLTSNKSFADWGETFSDPVLASAMLDRLLHHSTVINIRGDSYRMKSRRRTGTVPSSPAGVVAREN